MKLPRLSPYAALGILGILGAACGSSGDAGSGSTGPDAPPAAGPGTAPTGTPPPPSKTPPTADEITILGVTSEADASVVYTVASGGAARLEAQGLASHAVTVLAPKFGAADSVTIAGGVVAFWTGVDANAIGALHVFTRAGGVEDVSSASLRDVFAASSDGKRIAFTTSAVSGGTATVAVADRGASSSATTLPVSQAATDGACAIRVGFGGTRLFAGTCDDGATDATIRTVSSTGVTTTVLSGALSSSAWSAAATTGSRVFVVTKAGAASVRTVPGNSSTAIDTSVVSGTLAPDGSRVVYQTSDLSLKVAGTTAPIDRAENVANIRGLVAFSPDFDYALAYSTTDGTTTPPRIDVTIVETDIVKPFIPMPTRLARLLSLPTGEAVGFSKSEDYAIYLADVSGGAVSTGSLRAHPLAGGDDVTLADGALSRGAKMVGDQVVFAADPKQSAGHTVVELRVVAAGGGTPALTLPGAGPTFAVSGGQLVYVVPGEGIRVTALP